jgi:hypothetical protein
MFYPKRKKEKKKSITYIFVCLKEQQTQHLHVLNPFFVVVVVVVNMKVEAIAVSLMGVKRM